MTPAASPANNPPLGLPPGTRLQDGKYAVSSVLGTGGFAVTYRGGNLQARHYVIIKEFFPPGAQRRDCDVLPSEEAAFLRARESFIKQGHALETVQHPNIVRVLERFEAHNTAYVVLEHLEGKTLGQMLREGKHLNDHETVQLGLKICDALLAIHSHGWLHRDIKPDNILITPDGRPVLIDFGGARAFETPTRHMTQMVTPAYAPLEQYAVQTRSGPQSDIYSLCATLYHAACGEAPVAAPDRVLHVPMAALKGKAPQISQSVSDAIMVGLSLEMAARPADAKRFAEMLQGKAVAKAAAWSGAPGAIVGHAATAPLEQQHAAHPGYHHDHEEHGHLEVSTLMPENEVPEDLELRFQRLEAHTKPLNSLVFSPDGLRFATGAQDRLIYLWDARTGTTNGKLVGLESSVAALAWSPDGTCIASGCVDGTLCLWNLETGQASHTLHDTGEAEVRSLAFSSSRPLLACGGAEEWTIRDSLTGKVLARNTRSALAVNFSPDGETLVAGYADGIIDMIDCATGDSLRVIHAHAEDIVQLKFSPDGHWLATGGVDGYIRLWRLADGQKIWEHQPYLLPAMGISWTPDGKLIASAHRDHVYLWTPAGTLWQRFSQHKDRVTAVAFAPRVDESCRYLLASSSRDKSADICRMVGANG